MRTREQIAEDRAFHEAELRRCDDEEQSWSEMTQTDRIAEYMHIQKCCSARRPQCPFHHPDNSEYEKYREVWTTKARTFLNTLPGGWTDDQIVAVLEAIP